MTSVTLSGGLGNQLFQFFAALEAVRWQGIERIQVRCGFYERNSEIRSLDIIHCIDLSKLKIDFPDLNIEFVSSPFDMQFFKIANRLPKFLLPALDLFSDNSDLRRVGRSSNIVGYHQDVSKLPPRDSVKHYFAEPRHSLIFENSVHIRRGDYQLARNSHYGIVDICSIITLMRRQNLFANRTIVFSDADIRDDFFALLRADEMQNIRFSRDLKISSAEEFLLMRQAQNIICSNSTFSWWAAFGSVNARCIYLPDHWYKNVRTKENWLFDGVELYPVNLL